MKKTLLALALTGTFGVAAAQALSTGLPTNKPTVNTGTSTTAVVAQTTTAGKTDPHINPFNGKLQSAEQIQRELEQARMETQMLEERLKQTNLSEELRTVPARKAVELAQAATAMKKEEASQKDIEAAMRAPKISPAAASRAASAAIPVAKPVPVKKPRAAVKTPAKDTANNRPEGSQVAAAPALPRPTLVSVMAVGNSRSAVLDVSGGTMIVSDGETTPYGVLRVRDKDSVELGSATFRVHNATMARFVVSDAKAVAQPGSSSQGGGPAAVATPPAAAPAPQPVINTTTALPAQANGPLPALPLPPGTPAAPAQDGIGPKAQMPSLQLPPGVNLLPASR